jgi:hypothetical protein
LNTTKSRRGNSWKGGRRMVRESCQKLGIDVSWVGGLAGRGFDFFEKLKKHRKSEGSTAINHHRRGKSSDFGDYFCSFILVKLLVREVYYSRER